METISRKDLTIAWLAGLIDGDGCISLARIVNNRRTRKTWHLRPYLTVVTVCTSTMKHLREVYKELEVPVHIAAKNNGKNNKQIYVFETQGLKRCKTLIPLIMPYLVTKRQEAELIMEYIQIREDLFATKKHDPREDAILKELKQIKEERNTVKNPQRLYARLDNEKI